MLRQSSATSEELQLDGFHRNIQQVTDFVVPPTFSSEPKRDQALNLQVRYRARSIKYTHKTEGNLPVHCGRGVETDHNAGAVSIQVSRPEFYPKAP